MGDRHSRTRVAASRAGDPRALSDLVAFTLLVLATGGLIVLTGATVAVLLTLLKY